MVVILCHSNADFDAVGAMLGAAELYEGARLALPAGAGRAVRDFLSLHRDLSNIVEPGEIDPMTITRLVVVDTSTRSRLGPLADWLDLPGVEIHLFDHHLSTPPDFPTAHAVLRPVGAASTLIAGELRAQGIIPSPFAATAMLLGIYEDTGSLTYAATTAEDLETAAWLIRSGGSLEAAAEILNRGLTSAQRRLMGELISSMELREAAGWAVSFHETPPGEYVEDAADVVSRLLDAEELDAAVALLPMEGAIHVIARSRSAGVDVAELLRAVGGGGHPRAAAAVLRGLDVDEAREALLRALPGALHPEPVARDLMSNPVRVVPPTATVAEARREMIRCGHSGLVVAEDGRILGVVTRRDADKARHHRLEHAPVRAYMARSPRTVAPETPLSTMERLMIRNSIGRLPVVEDGRLVGIVTRSDLLTALHGLRYASTRPNARDDVASRLAERLPAPVQRLLARIGSVSGETGQAAYLVGGFVRDALIGVPNLDIDILVEPDAQRLAAALAAAVGGEFKFEERFGTARVTLPEAPSGGLPPLCRVDLATARQESYAHPGALPEVEPSSVLDDLRRRDFTINAMALTLGDDGPGDLVDPHGGGEDIEHRVVRILHPLSFVEDPTRILRAVRFETRYGFAMDSDTESRARAAIEEGRLRGLTPLRIWRELGYLLQEQRALGGLRRLAELGILADLDPAADADPEWLRRVPAAMEWWANATGEPMDRRLVLLGAVLRNSDAAAIHALATQRLGIAPAEAERLAVIAGAPGRALDLTSPELSPAAITSRLRGVPPEGLILLRASLGDDAERRALVDAYVTGWRHVRLEINGDDLQALGYLPGRRLGDALAATLSARLNEEIMGRDAELHYAVAQLVGAARGSSGPAETVAS